VLIVIFKVGAVFDNLWENTRGDMGYLFPENMGNGYRRQFKEPNEKSFRAQLFDIRTKH
jgi:hypothetical protein